MPSNSKHLLLTYLFINCIGLLFLIFDHQGFANKILNYSFYLLIYSVIIYLKEVFDES